MFLARVRILSFYIMMITVVRIMKDGVQEIGFESSNASIAGITSRLNYPDISESTTHDLLDSKILTPINEISLIVKQLFVAFHSNIICWN